MEQQEFNFCNYPGCNQLANQIFRDEKHGGIYCSEHCFNCDECQELHGKQEKTVLEFRQGNKKNYCKDCFDKNTMMQCPHCKRVINKDEFLSPENSKIDFPFKDSIQQIRDGEHLCESCFDETYYYCDECNEYVDTNDMIYIEDTEESMCSSCYKNKYTDCYECDKKIVKDDSQEYDGEYYCDKCAPFIKIKEHQKHIDKFPAFTYTPKDKILNQLQKILPISIKKLKLQHPQIAAGLNDLISFSKGKDLTQEMVLDYRESLNPEEFPVEYMTWDGLQRSTDNLSVKPKKDQLVLIIDASKNINKILFHSDNQPLRWLFDNTNSASEQGGHPSTTNSIGWARLELDPHNEYILVDEIQSDHLNSSHTLKTNMSNEAESVRGKIKEQFQLTDEQLKNVLNEYYNLLKDFPQIVNQAITRFAKDNGFTKIYWHTYESGKELKQNDPPKSLYTKLPKEHGYNETENRPFNLPGKFFEREARVNYLKRLTKDNKCREKTM